MVSIPWSTSSICSGIAKRHEQLAVPGLLVAPFVLLLNHMNIIWHGIRDGHEVYVNEYK